MQRWWSPAGRHQGTRGSNARTIVNSAIVGRFDNITYILICIVKTAFAAVYPRSKCTVTRYMLLMYYSRASSIASSIFGSFLSPNAGTNLRRRTTRRRRRTCRRKPGATEGGVAGIPTLKRSASEEVTSEQKPPPPLPPSPPKQQQQQQGQPSALLHQALEQFRTEDLTEQQREVLREKMQSLQALQVRCRQGDSI